MIKVKDKKTKTILLIASIVLIVAAIIMLQKPWESKKAVIPAALRSAGAESNGPMIGQSSVDFTLMSIDGKQISLSDFKGKPIVLNFWATWCPDCLNEMPWFEEEYRKSNGSIVFIGVDLQESGDKVMKFVSEHSITYPILLDPDGTVRGIYHSMGVPTTYFINSNGTVVDKKNGGLTLEELQQKLEEIKD